MSMFSKKSKKDASNDKSEVPVPSKKESLALALGMQKRAKAKMAKGGEIPMKGNCPHCGEMPGNKNGHKEDCKMFVADAESVGGKSPKMMADGGPVGKQKEADEKPKTLANAIMKSRPKETEEEEGPTIDLEQGEGDADDFEEGNEEAADKKVYDDSQLEEQPEESNEHADNIISDMHDMISKIRAHLKSKRGS